jgi:magnesium-transporting ATPase (P-type)
MPGDDEKIVKEDPYPEMMQFFTEFQSFIEDLVKKYNLDTKYTFPNKSSNFDEDFHENLDYSDFESQNADENNNSEKSSYSSCKSKIVDFNSFNYLKERNLLEPFSIIVEAPILCGLFKDNDCTKKFLNIAYYSSTVICCRVSPSQKSEVIKKMKHFDKTAITLAIGDGGNDVSMIMEANIGIGIYGEEGMSAAQASDFSIGEFQILKRLLFIHGRINLFRISKMILYFFYKNFVFTLIQFYFAFFCLASGQTIFDDWYITCYNLVFTAFPLCVAAITDSDIDLNDIKMVKKNLALLYKENRDTHIIFSFVQFLVIIGKGIIISFSIYIHCCHHEILNTKGNYSSIWYLSLKTYICVLVIVTTNLLLKCSFIVHILLLSIGITTYLLFIIFLILNHYGFLFKFNSKASIFTSLSSQLLYLSAILIISFSFIFDYSFKLIDLFMSKSLSSKLILSNTLKQKKRKSSFAIEQTPIINFKQITKKRNSVEISRNFLVNRLPMIMENFNNQIETPKNINFLNQFHPSNKLENK